MPEEIEFPIEGEELYQVETMADGLRNTGYKTTYNAIAEIVDNSIEANAKNVFIIGTQGLVVDQQRITEFAFLDDGDGMAIDILSKCLKIGFSTRRARKGMGRFGVGLPQASFSVAPCVKVYSWKNGIENAQVVYIDLDLVSSSQQDRIFGPYPEKIPSQYNQFINFRTENKNYDFSKHGTLVVWERCDKVTHKKWATCKRKLNEDLGRKYRWMIHNETVEISTVLVDDLGAFERMLPNDPLFLMKKDIHAMKPEISDSDAQCLPYSEENGYTESMFEPFTSDENKTGVVEKEVFYFDKDGNKKTSTVKLTFSIVKEKYYSQQYVSRDPGSLPYGKAALSNMGISIIRQGREIDFDPRFFEFADSTNTPYHRWWGCEISFSSELDEAFGISNNKQQVILRSIDDEALADYDGDEPMWVQLSGTIKKTISDMVAANKERRKGSRTLDSTSTATTATSEVIKSSEDANPDIKVEIENKPDEITDEIKDKVIEELKSEGFEDVTDEQIKQYLDSNTRIKYVKHGPRSPFIDYEDELGVLKVLVNTEHKFFINFVENAYADENMKITFELFLAALIKSVYGLSSTYSQPMGKLVDRINERLKLYLEQESESI